MAESPERATEDLRLANLDLEQRVSELTTLNELGLALSATRDIDELVGRALGSVVTHLHFDRALVLLDDEERGLLGRARSAGGPPGSETLVAGLEVPLTREGSQLVALYRSDGPVLFQDLDLDPDGPARELATTLGVTSFLGTPLVTRGRAVGVLAVDNGLSGRPLEPDDGPLLFTVGNVIAAAVENARLYAEIERQNRALEERVVQRTAQLATALEEAQAERAAAEASSAAKSALVASVSHELRTPLASVVGFTKLIQRRLGEVVFPATAADDPKVARTIGRVTDDLRIMVVEGERLGAMIDDVLDLAKIEAGRFEWAMRPVTISEVVDRATAATAPLFETSSLRLEVAVEPGLPELVGDRDRLIQVLVNLLSNAVKFTRQGGVGVAARRDGDGIVVTVTDTGLGIAPEDHEKVWESYGQAGDALADRPRGTGLGLPICRQIVERHGGRMWLDSTLGAGSTFAFRLPLGEPAPG